MCSSKVWLNTSEKSLANPSGLVALPDGKMLLPLSVLLLEHSTSIVEQHAVIFRASLNLLVYIIKGSAKRNQSLTIVLHSANQATDFKAWFSVEFKVIPSFVSTECSTSPTSDGTAFVTRKSEPQGEITIYISYPWDYNNPNKENPGITSSMWMVT